MQVFVCIESNVIILLHQTHLPATGRAIATPEGLPMYFIGNQIHLACNACFRKMLCGGIIKMGCNSSRIFVQLSLLRIIKDQSLILF
jgi:hypothetical protein